MSELSHKTFVRSVLAVLLLALVLRTIDIATESLWVDEAFSEAASRGTVAEILEANARDTHPPLHSLVLAGWRAVFEPEGADPDTITVVLRGNSVLWSLLALAIAMQLAREIAGPRVALVAGAFLTLSPIDIYFANEVRSYIQLSALGMLGAWAMWRWCAAVRREAAMREAIPWVALFATAGVLMIYTHYLGITLLVGQGMLGLAVFVSRRQWSSVSALAVAAVAVAALFAPWIFYVLSFRDTLERTASIDWMPVPALVDFVSMVGREYVWGRVHKIHAEWGALSAVVPAGILLAAATLAAQRSGRRVAPGVVFLAGCFVLPLVLAGAVSYLDQVIYYRPRFSVLLVPVFSIALAWACCALGSPKRSAIAVSACALLLCAGVVAQVTTPQKRAWRETALDWPRVDAPAFYVVLPAEHQRPLRHYLGDRIRHTPRWVLERLAPLPEGALVWVASWPEPLVGDDAEYRDWLKQVGDARRQVLGTHYTLTQVEPRGATAWPEFARGRFEAWYRPFDIRGEVAGFSEARHFGPLRFDDESGDAFRTARQRGVLRFDSVRRGRTFVLRAEVEAGVAAPRLLMLRGRDPSRLASEGVALTHDESMGEYRGVVPEGEGPLWVGWADPDLDDDAWRIHWVGVEAADDNALDAAGGMAFHP